MRKNKPTRIQVSIKNESKKEGQKNITIKRKNMKQNSGDDQQV